ncbi:MAG: DUF4230 domain-containing protein [Anaerolineales bacterium]|nr:DUF4230 domain-containing protein [Anaerolineales bacterium]
MSNQTSSPLRTIFAIIVVILLFFAVWYGISSINQSISSALNPLQYANDALSTQVSELLHPTPTVIPDPVTIIHEVQAVARLETVHYTVEKVVTAEENQGVLSPLFGDRLLFVGHGYVTAGIDMQKISEDDLWLQDGVLYVRLPAAEIFDATLNNDQSYVYDRDTGLLTHGNDQLETLARQVAQEQILQAALDDGILQQAQVNAQSYMRWFFEALGYENVIFVDPGP